MGSGGWQHGGAAASFVEGGRGRGAAVEAEGEQEKASPAEGTSDRRGKRGRGGRRRQQPTRTRPPHAAPSGNWITRWMDG